MTISDINAFVTLRTGADTTQYSAANRLISTNRWYHKAVTMILDSQDEWDWDDSNQSDYPIATTNLVASQQDYTFPASLKLLKIKRVEYTPDGTNWYKVEPLDVNELTTSTDSTSVRNDFQSTQPYYDVQNGAIFLYPVPTQNVTSGLKVWFAREPAEFTSAEVTTGTKEPGFDEPFHVMIALGMCYDWFASKSNLQAQARAVWDEINDYEARLRTHYGSKDKDRVYQLKPTYINYK